MNLVMFVPCEKLLLDNNGAASIIVLLGAITIGAQPKIPSSAITPELVLPKEWAMTAMWRVPPEERNREFVQVFRIVWPNGSDFHVHRLPFKTTSQVQALNYVNMIGMPIGQKGTLHLEAWVEEPGGNIVTAVAEFDVSVNHEV